MKQAVKNRSPWRKPRRSYANGNCVEVSSASGRILVRDSRHPAGVMLSIPAGPWKAFAILVGSTA